MAEATRVAIFDFDGTIADSAPLIVNVYNKMAEKRGWRVIGKDDMPSLRSGGFRDAITWAGIKLWQLPRLIMDGRKLFKLETETVKLFKGMPELIAALKKDGYKIYILSRNKREVVIPVLEKYNVSRNVSVLKSTSFFGGKHKTIRALVSKEKYDRKNVWMIGDETRDIEAAHKAKVKSIGVTWGLQDAAVLKLYNPTELANKPAEVRRYLIKGAK